MNYKYKGFDIISKLGNDGCIVCGKRLNLDHKTPFCRKHYNEYRRSEKIRKWLETGDMGFSADTTVKGVIREYILNEQDGCCAICGIKTEWNNKPLKFILDHIDGNATNSARENVRLICPNCDSQLDTYKSKNKHSARSGRKEYLKEVRKDNMAGEADKRAATDLKSD